MNQQRHTPVRTCIGCGGRDRQADMIRVVYREGRILVSDPRRKHGGRGGYLHRAENCWGRFAGRKGMVRSLGISIDRAARGALIDDLRLRFGR